jgi:hypothetical protein
VPLAGAVTRERVSDLLEGGRLDYDETATIKGVMERHNVHGSVLDMAALLKELNVDLHTLATPAPPPAAAQAVTPGDREKALRGSIEALVRRLDAHTGSDFGTWNGKCFREAQGCRKRETLTEAELREVWKWCCVQAGTVGLEV